MVRDDALRDLAITPVLGRGYSLATNTYQSICFSKIVRTKPSYDFQFVFRELTAEQAATLKTSGSVELDVKLNLGVAGGKISADVDRERARSRNQEKTYIQVSIDMNSYYASIDESNASLSDSAASLLKANDVMAFFDACGMYYVRSINRKSKYVSVFEFQASSKEESDSFTAELEAEVKGWGQGAGVGVAASKSTTQTASRKQLTITASGWGLGKAESDGLVSYDLDSFRKAVKAAFVATQEDDVGRVTSIEIVPWTEYTEFQSLLLGKSVRGAGKRNLLLNAEFLAEVNRSARARLNAYYGAKQCRADIESNYRKTTPSGTAWRAAPEVPGATYDQLYAKNHRLPTNRTLSVKDVYDATRPAVQQMLYNEYDAFMYGGKDDLPRVVQNGIETTHPRIPDADTRPTTAEQSDWLAQATTAFQSILESPPDDANSIALKLRLVRAFYTKAKGVDVPLNTNDLAEFTAWYEDKNTPTRLLTDYPTTARLITAAIEDAFNVKSFVAESEVGWWQQAAGGLLDALPYRLKAEARPPEELAVAAIMNDRMRTYIENILKISVTKIATVDDLVDPTREPPALPGPKYDDLQTWINSEAFSNLKKARPAREIAVATLLATLKVGKIERKDEAQDTATDTYAIAYLWKQMRDFGRDELAKEIATYLNGRLRVKRGETAAGATLKWDLIRRDAQLKDAGPVAQVSALFDVARPGAQPPYRTLPPPSASDLPGTESGAVFSSLQKLIASNLYAEYKRQTPKKVNNSLAPYGFFGSSEFVGASRCIDQLLTGNRLMTDSYRNVEVCQRLEGQLSTPHTRIIDDFCMPKALPQKRGAP